MTRQTINTSNYRWAHGREPRGRGRWMFEMTTSAGQEMFCHTGTYTEARTAAFREARWMDATNVRVMS